MFPPWVCAIWQSLAHGAMTVTNGFASRARFAQDTRKTLACSADGPFCDDCYPSPYPWPGPLWVRPSFVGDRWCRIAEGAVWQSFGFHPAPNAVESGAITTITRGSVTCGNRPLSSWRFVRPPFQLVSTTICNVAALAHLAVLSWLMRLAAMLSPGHLSVQARAWCATIWAFVSKPYPVGQHRPAAYRHSETTRANRPGGFFMSAWRIAPRKDSNV